MAHGVQPTTQLDHIFAALNHPTRRAMLKRLARGPARISELTKLAKLPVQNTWKHVNMLERAGFVRFEAAAGNAYLVVLRMAPFRALLRWVRTVNK